MESDAAHNHVVFQPKQSRANKLWLLILIVVLVVLFFEMHGNSRSNYNCCISTDTDSIGAEVFIDHQKVGTIAKDESGGLGGGAYRCLLSSGHHLIEIKKPDYKTYSREVDMRKEQYIEADLEKTSG